MLGWPILSAKHAAECRRYIATERLITESSAQRNGVDGPMPISEDEVFGKHFDIRVFEELRKKKRFPAMLWEQQETHAFALGKAKSVDAVAAPPVKNLSRSRANKKKDLFVDELNIRTEESRDFALRVVGNPKTTVVVDVLNHAIMKRDTTCGSRRLHDSWRRMRRTLLSKDLNVNGIVETVAYHGAEIESKPGQDLLVVGANTRHDTKKCD